MTTVIVTKSERGWDVLAGGDATQCDSRREAEQTAKDQTPLGTTLIIDRRSASSFMPRVATDGGPNHG